jgi:hypothetical protein
MQTNKTCWDCKQDKPLSEFPKDITRQDGYAYQCKSCYRRKKREYEKNRYNTDIKFQTNRKRKRRINDLLRCKYPDKISNILKYSKQQLIDNIQSKFKEGMSWDNYGEWHIDHITPLDHYDINIEDYIVSNLNNLQPLWSKDNINKSNKLHN